MTELAAVGVNTWPVKDSSMWPGIRSFFFLIVTQAVISIKGLKSSFASFWQLVIKWELNFSRSYFLVNWRR